VTDSAINQARPIKRKRRTKAQIQQLQQQILGVLISDHPQSVRHVFYRMTDPTLPEPVDKTEQGYNQVQYQCTRMRREGIIPYGWFSDTTRYGYFVNTFEDASDFILAMQSQYRADLWVNADARCEVWVESRSIAGVLHEVCSQFAVDLFPCGGFPSLTFVHESAESNNKARDQRPLHIFYIGDYDPAGVIIYEKLQQELRQHLDDCIELHFRRLGINTEQIRTYSLPTKPRKASDKRAKHIEETVEAEAMPARIMREILTEAIEALLPAHALAVAKVAEQSERQHLCRLADLLMDNRQESPH
jgi:hypothetical protein